MSRPAVYERLARHLGKLVSGYPFRETLLELLQENFSPREAELVLAIPNHLAPLELVPLEQIARRAGVRGEEAKEVLENLAQRGVIYSGSTAGGEPGYAHLQVGYGMPQSFFWGGKEDERARRMAGVVLKYFTVDTTREIYGGRPTKIFRYSPAALTVEAPRQGVMPGELIQNVVQGAQKIAVAHCPCRMAARVLGRSECQHSLEVCFKYDEMAEFVLDRGLGRELSADEALSIMRDCEKEGLVHMVDNAAAGVKHTCNCCGHWCWNVGIIRRRKIPRDVLMASYFIRVTDEDECVGCQACEQVCPVDAVSMVDGVAKVDEDWCIGCGVCMVRCPTQAIGLERRVEQTPPADFSELTRRLRVEQRA